MPWVVYKNSVFVIKKSKIEKIDMKDIEAVLYRKNGMSFYTTDSEIFCKNVRAGLKLYKRILNSYKLQRQTFEFVEKNELDVSWKLTTYTDMMQYVTDISKSLDNIIKDCHAQIDLTGALMMQEIEKGYVYYAFEGYENKKKIMINKKIPWGRTIILAEPHVLLSELKDSEFYINLKCEEELSGKLKESLFFGGKM